MCAAHSANTSEAFASCQVLKWVSAMQQWTGQMSQNFSAWLVFSLVLNKKNHFDQHKALVIVLSVINMIVGIIMWLFVVMIMQMP